MNRQEGCRGVECLSDRERAEAEADAENEAKDEAEIEA